MISDCARGHAARIDLQLGQQAGDRDRLVELEAFAVECDQRVTPHAKRPEWSAYRAQFA